MKLVKVILIASVVLMAGVLLVAKANQLPTSEDKNCSKIKVSEILTINRDYILYKGQDGNYYYEHTPIFINLRQPGQNICVSGEEVEGGD